MCGKQSETGKIVSQQREDVRRPALKKAVAQGRVEVSLAAMQVSVAEEVEEEEEKGIQVIAEVLVGKPRPACMVGN